MNLTHTDKIFLAKKKLLETQPHYGFVLLVCKITGVDTKQDSSAPDTFWVTLPQAEIFYSISLCERLSINEIMTCLAHECRHVIQETYQRAKNINTISGCSNTIDKTILEFSNIAHDYVINRNLISESFVLPCSLYHYNNFDDIPTDQRFWLLVDLAHSGGFEEFYSLIRELHENVSTTHDAVDLWLFKHDKTEEIKYDRDYIRFPDLYKREGEKSDRDGQISAKIYADKDPKFIALRSYLDHEIEQIYRFLFDNSIDHIDLQTYKKFLYLSLRFPDCKFSNDPERSQKEWEKKLQELRHAASLEKQNITREKIPKDLERIFDEISGSKIDIASRIKIFMGSHGPKNRRSFSVPCKKNMFKKNFAIKRGVKSDRGDIYILLDTSGSMFSQDKITKKCIQTLLGLSKTYGQNTKFIMCDSQIHSVMSVYEFERMVRSKKFKLKGFGGSDFNPAFKYIWDTARKTKNGCTVLAFTDGDISVPKQIPKDIKTEVYWILTDNSEQPAEYGKTFLL